MRIEGGDAYVSGPLWREEHPTVPNNYDMAKRRLKSLEKKFENNPEMKQKYAESIRDDGKKGYVKKLSEAELQSESKVICSSTPRNPIVLEECLMHQQNLWAKV